MPSQEPDLLNLIDDKRTTSFGDASCPPSFKFDDVEVLAAIPDHVSDRGLALPGKEYKYKDYSQLCKEKLHATVSRWDDVICHASICIYDPQDVIGLIASWPQFDHMHRKYGPERAQEWLEKNLAY